MNRKREHLPERLKRVLTDKVTLAALILIITGLVMVQLSYHYTDTIITPNMKKMSVTLGSESSSSVHFYQNYKLTETVSFEMPSGDQVHYRLYQYNVYQSSKGIIVHQYVYLKNGTATNGSVVHLSSLFLPQGQTYSLNMTSLSGNSFQVQVTTLENVSVVEHSARDLGGPGVIMIILGAVLMAYAITRFFEVDVGSRIAP